MTKSKEYEYNNALEQLNKELIHTLDSKEFKTGQKKLKLKYAIRHLKFGQIFIGIKHKIVASKLKKSHVSNENFITYDDNITTDKRIAVYTCITGNYDSLLEPLIHPDNIDYYVITDMNIDKNSKWIKIDINKFEELKKLDNTRKARYAKTHPHMFFGEYEYSIWVDSNFRIVSDLSKFIKNTNSTVPFASHWHPYRNCIYTESIACKMRKKDDEKIINNQIDFYRKDGMPDNFGLIETNMIVRKHMDEKCIKIMEEWWNNIIQWSKRDQLSLPYVIWKNGYTMKDFGFIGKNVRENYSVQVLLHTSSYKGNY